MPILAGLDPLLAELTELRRDIHAHPETAFEEHRTAALVAEHLTASGLEIDQGLAGTGVVGVLRQGEGPTIALRADMDALNMDERTNLPWASRHSGKMHACGHDGHTAMLLGAARYLAQHGGFSGTVYVIFQPAEELEGGAQRMVDEGLFDRFPSDAVYGLHNWPRLPLGRFASRNGPLMAACDVFDVTLVGKGAHAAMPHQGVDPVATAAQVICALQHIVSRHTNPLEALVISVTKLHGGDSHNVIPDEAHLAGTVRSFLPAIRDAAESQIRRVVTQVSSAFGCQAEITYSRRYPPVINHPGETVAALTAAARVVGAEQVDDNPQPTMGAEDFSYMLEKRPGNYIWMGTGRDADSPSLHNPVFDFNDEALALGISYWVELVRQQLPGS